MNELKPCPFCGGEATLYFSFNRLGQKEYGVMCTDCWMASETEEEAIKQWNRRTEK